MAGTVVLGKPVKCNIERSEDDTDDIAVHSVDSDGVDVAVVGWTILLSIGPDNDSAATVTFSGTGIAAGLLPIDMTTFALAKGSYKYDIRITDTVVGDSPARVYFKGSFKVTPRIN